MYSLVSCFETQSWIFGLGMQNLITPCISLFVYCFIVAFIFVEISHMHALNIEAVPAVTRSITYFLLLLSLYSSHSVFIPLHLMPIYTLPFGHTSSISDMHTQTHNFLYCFMWTSMRKKLFFFFPNFHYYGRWDVTN